MEDPAGEEWQELWRGSEDEYARDLTGDLRSAMADDGLREPRGTRSLAVASAWTASSARSVLDGEWALYTPQQAAVVASAVFSQVRDAAGSLRALAKVLESIQVRGDMPRDTSETGLLAVAADGLDAVVDQHAGQVTKSLDALPCPVEPPADIHRTLAGVAPLLGPLATLNDNSAADDHDPQDASGYGCGCDIDIPVDGDRWNFHRGDSAWSLIRESDGVKRADGSVIFMSSADLAASDPLADPRHLAALIREAVGLTPTG